MQKLVSRVLFLSSIFYLLSPVPSPALAQSPVTLTIDTQAQGCAIPDDSTGLSFETLTLLPDRNGGHFFSGTNTGLVTLFHNLGVKNLRIGDEPSTNSSYQVNVAAASAVVVRIEATTSRHADSSPAPADPWLWLEVISGEKPLAWVHEQNERTFQRLKTLPAYPGLYRDALAVLDSETRIPEVHQMDTYLYNLWQDKEHPRGMYRRTSREEFRRPKPRWETVLDVDALSRAENKPWAFGGMTCLPPDYQHALIRLSPGGGDAVEIREFDTGTLLFVKDGFFLPASKSFASWLDANTLYVGTDFGPDTLTKSGYPRVVKQWKRGTPLSAAKTIYQAEKTSVRAEARRIRTSTGDIDILTDEFTFWRARYFQVLDGQLGALELPETAVIAGGYRGRLLVELKEDWERSGHHYPNGSVLLAEPGALRGAGTEIQLLVRPTTNEVVKSVAAMPQGILVTVLDNVRGRIYRYQVSSPDIRRQLIPFPDNGALRITSTSDETGDVFAQYESFLTPPTLYHFTCETLRPEPTKSQQPTFDGRRFKVQQYWATSADGTRIPYFLVASKQMKFNGKNPVWMFSYGGFENSLTPSYSGSYEDLHGAYGKLWLERGGMFVLANIRGGGEFGPAWHTQALKQNHIRAFEDFEAVARDLAARKVTSPRHLGIEGRSNGGLLVASTMLRHPELYGAVVCGSPLIDMKRYHQLLAGASWVAEYGDPDLAEDWDYLGRYSPYQNAQAGRAYPPVFFYSSTRDDRVHPGHARKMVAKMESMGYDVCYYENTEGGHHGSVTHEQLATRLALAYAFLWQHLAEK
jgi:prolyl oligopeptidase